MYNLLLPKLDMPANRTNSDQIRCIAIITLPILHITAYTMTKSPTAKRKATLAAAKKTATAAAAKKAATAAVSKAALQAEDQVGTTTPNRKKRKVAGSRETTPTAYEASNAPAAKKSAGTKPPGKKPSASVETAKDQVTTTPAAKAASKGTAAEKTDGTKPADDTRAEDTAIPADDPPAEVVCTTTDDHRPMGPVGNNPTAITTADVAAVAEDEPQGTLVSKDAGSDAVPVSEDTGAGAHRPKGLPQT